MDLHAKASLSYVVPVCMWRSASNFFADHRQTDIYIENISINTLHTNHAFAPPIPPIRSLSSLRTIARRKSEKRFQQRILVVIGSAANEEPISRLREDCLYKDKVWRHQIKSARWPTTYLLPSRDTYTKIFLIRSEVIIAWFYPHFYKS